MIWRALLLALFCWADYPASEYISAALLALLLTALVAHTWEPAS